jgi:hypothetical protein
MYCWSCHLLLQPCAQKTRRIRVVEPIIQLSAILTVPPAPREQVSSQPVITFCHQAALFRFFLKVQYLVLNNQFCMLTAPTKRIRNASKWQLNTALNQPNYRDKDLVNEEDKSTST